MVAEFVRSVLIDAPVDDVFRFHEREDALSLLAPAFPPVRVISRTGRIETGARVELRVGVFRWAALHTSFEKNRLFEDRQIRGPFAKWVHRHEFEAAGARTRLTDRIEYELPGGMFAHRHRVTKAFCERHSAGEAL